MLQRIILKSTENFGLEVIPVKKLVYKFGHSFSEEEVIDVILGRIHIEGPEAWGAMQKAHYIHKSYRRELAKVYKNGQYMYVKNIATNVGRSFNCKEREIKKMLTVYRVYAKMRRNNYEVKPAHYTLIELATHNQALRNNYFELNDESMTLSSAGMEKFFNLCVMKNAPIHNPPTFRYFSYIYEKGTDYDLLRAECADAELSQIKRKIAEREKNRVFYDKLINIKESIRALKINDFRGIVSEIKEIENIKKLVDNRLWPLSKIVTNKKT